MLSLDLPISPRDYMYSSSELYLTVFHWKNDISSAAFDRELHQLSLDIYKKPISSTGKYTLIMWVRFRKSMEKCGELRHFFVGRAREMLHRPRRKMANRSSEGRTRKQITRWCCRGQRLCPGGPCPWGRVCWRVVCSPSHPTRQAASSIHPESPSLPDNPLVGGGGTHANVINSLLSKYGPKCFTISASKFYTHCTLEI